LLPGDERLPLFLVAVLALAAGLREPLLHFRAGATDSGDPLIEPLDSALAERPARPCRWPIISDGAARARGSCVHPPIEHPKFAC
jgi:hypothetical protein